METHRQTAILAGVLFILATVSSVTSFGWITGPILASPDLLEQVAANRDFLVTGVNFELINNFAVAAIGVVLFPVLRSYSMMLALGYLAARFTEAILITIGDLSILSLVSVGQSFQAAGGENEANYLVVAEMLKSVVDWTLVIGPGIVLAINAAILNYILYRTRLVPVWLSVWGLASSALLFLGDLLGMYEIGNVLMFAAPFALQEMVLAVWLIVVGFSEIALREMAQA